MMFNKVMRRANTQMSMLGLARRSILTPAGKPYVIPESLNDVITHLDSVRPPYTLLYFNAAWNPKCAEIEQDYENLCHKHGNWHHMRVDCDAAPTVKRYFDCRVEPQFLMLFHGGEMMRQIGYNFDRISN